MDVAERQDELERQREQRQPRSQPNMRSEPAHCDAPEISCPQQDEDPVTLFYNMAAPRQTCQVAWALRRRFERRCALRDTRREDPEQHIGAPRDFGAYVPGSAPDQRPRLRHGAGYVSTEISRRSNVLLW